MSVNDLVAFLQSERFRLSNIMQDRLDTLVANGDEGLLDCFIVECIKHQARYINDSDCIAILENAIDSYAKTLASTTKLKNFKGSVYDEQHVLTHYYRIKLKKGVAQWLL